MALSNPSWGHLAGCLAENRQARGKWLERDTETNFRLLGFGSAPRLQATPA